MLRAQQLGLIGLGFYRLFCLQAGNIWRRERKEPGDQEYRGDETATRYEQLVLRATEEDQISQSKAAEMLGLTIQELRVRMQAPRAGVPA